MIFTKSYDCLSTQRQGIVIIRDYYVNYAQKVRHVLF